LLRQELFDSGLVAIPHGAPIQTYRDVLNGKFPPVGQSKALALEYDVEPAELPLPADTPAEVVNVEAADDIGEDYLFDHLLGLFEQEEAGVVELDSYPRSPASGNVSTNATPVGGAIPAGDATPVGRPPGCPSPGGDFGNVSPIAGPKDVEGWVCASGDAGFRDDDIPAGWGPEIFASAPAPPPELPPPPEQAVEHLLRARNWGVFRITPKQAGSGGGAYGGFQASCCFHAKNSKTGCKKWIPIVANTDYQRNVRPTDHVVVHFRAKFHTAAGPRRC
jgi:hypothetical protein